MFSVQILRAVAVLMVVPFHELNKVQTLGVNETLDAHRIDITPPSPIPARKSAEVTSISFWSESDAGKFFSQQRWTASPAE